VPYLKSIAGFEFLFLENCERPVFNAIPGDTRLVLILIRNELNGLNVVVEPESSRTQTRPAMPASAPKANSHSGFHGLRKTTATVSSVIK
jgi:hypothetical protein